jgi:hypothetical protein
LLGKDVIILAGLSSCAVDVKSMGLKQLVDDARFMQDDRLKKVCPKLKVVHRNEDILNVEGILLSDSFSVFVCLFVCLFVCFDVFMFTL